MSIHVRLFAKVGQLLQKRISQSPALVILRLSGGRAGEKGSLNVQTFTPPQPPSDSDVPSTKSPGFSFSGK